MCRLHGVKTTAAAFQETKYVQIFHEIPRNGGPGVYDIMLLLLLLLLRMYRRRLL